MSSLFPHSLTTISSCNFSFLSTEDVDNLSVKHITSSSSFDLLNQPVPNGLYDLALGPFQGSLSNCITCGQYFDQCPGHYGHISLCIPLYQPLLFPLLYKILRISCFSCHRFRITSEMIHLFQARLKSLELNDLSSFFHFSEFDSKEKKKGCSKNPDIKSFDKTSFSSFLILEKFSSSSDSPSEYIQEMRYKVINEFLSSSTPKCPHCDTIASKITHQSNHSFYQHFKDKEIKSKELRYILSSEVFQHLEKLFKCEQLVLNSLFSHHGVLPLSPHFFFLFSLPVIPSRFRPPSNLNKTLYAHPLSYYYSKIIDIHNQLFCIISSPDSSNSISPLSLMISLQQYVNNLFDNKNDRSFKKQSPNGLRQILEKKEGLFRSYFMGKRVNYAARSVISPDPYIHVSEIIIPLAFATVLTYPETVNDINYSILQQYIINGPFHYPGANYLEDCNGSLIDLSYLNLEQRQSLAKTLFSSFYNAHNASQHSSSVSIVSGSRRVYRHLINGDLILANRQPTLHRQSMIGLRCRVMPSEQTLRIHYANCKGLNADFDGDEINVHLPQDPLSRSELLNILLADQQYYTTTNGSPIRGLIQDQLISSILFTLPDSFFNRYEAMNLLFSSLNFLSPLLQYSLCQPAILKPYPLWTGKQIISMILSSLSNGRPPLNMQSKAKINSNLWLSSSHQLLQSLPSESTVLIRQNYLCVGVLDKQQIGSAPYGLIHATAVLHGFQSAGNLLSCLSRLFLSFLQLKGFTLSIDDLKLTKDMDFQRRCYIDKATEQCLSRLPKLISPHSSLRSFLQSNIQHMEQLDQFFHQILEPIHSKIIKKGIPFNQSIPFPFNNLSLMTQSGSKGSIVNHSQISCLLGQQELEGHRVPLMCTGRSLPTFSSYDTHPESGGFIKSRFLTGLKPSEYFFHCMAGREGLVDTAVKTANAGYLQRCLIKHLESLKVHHDLSVRDEDGSLIQFLYGDDGLDPMVVKHLESLDFFSENYLSLLPLLKPHEILDRVDCVSAMEYNSHDSNPVTSVFSPLINLGAVSESFQKKIKNYLSSHTSFTSHELTAEKFTILMYLYYIKCLITPGEMVGILAAQGLGEPSTQMTLNTFHLAGSSQNVTLGIPRMRELIMSSSQNIKTPIMNLSAHDQTKKTSKYIVDLLRPLLLVEILQKTDIEEIIEENIHFYHVTITFSKESIDAFSLNYEKIVQVIETKVIPPLLTSITKQFNIQQTLSSQFTLPSYKNSRESLFENQDKPFKESNSYNDDDIKYLINDNDLEENYNNESIQSDIDDNEMVEINADVIKANSRKLQNIKYEDDEYLSNSEPENNDSITPKSSNSKLKSKNIKNKLVNENQPSLPPALVKSKSPYALSSRRRKLFSCSPYLYCINYNDTIPLYNFSLYLPINRDQIMLSYLLEKIISKVKINEVPHISNCMMIEKDQKYSIETTGVNLPNQWPSRLNDLYDLVDINNITSNDIFSLFTCYGIEAGRQSIVDQITNTFECYGIEVDYRHIGLVADYMTSTGCIRPLNHTTMKNKTSPFQQMSFERASSYLSDSCLYHHHDSMQSPSSQIVMGQVVSFGSGSFDLFYDLSTSDS